MPPAIEPAASVDAHEIRERNPILCALSDGECERLSLYFERVRVPSGTPIVRQGDSDRATFFVLAGEARIVRNGIDLGVILPGNHFGEFAMVVRRPRQATILSSTPMELARLSDDAWGEMREREPRLALNLLTAFVGGVADRLTDMSDRVGVLLHDRGLPRRVDIDLRVMGEGRTVATGTRARDLLPERIDGQLVVAALVDRKAVSLTTPVSSSCELEPLTIASLDGQRFFRHSQALLLLEAAHRRDPNLKLRLSHSVGFAQRVDAGGVSDMMELRQLGAALEKGMTALTDADEPLREDEATVAEARDHFEARGWSDAAQLFTYWRGPSVKLCSYGDVFVPSPGPLLPSAGPLAGSRIVADGGGLLLVYAGEPAQAWNGNGNGRSKLSTRSEALAAVRQTTPSTEEQHRWLEAVGIRSVGEFNAACVRGDVSQIIHVSEGFQEKRVGAIADAIAGRAERVKIVTVAGPSSSGKTTFIKRLKVQLQVNGIKPVGLSLDDYYCDREDTPKDDHGQYDYESFDALRRDLLHDHLRRLVDGETVRTARYDFLTGRSHEAGGPDIHLGPKDVLMIEGIHGLNPRLLTDMPGESVFRIFVCPLTQLPFDPLTRVHVSDVRLLRRIIRDRHGRGSRAADNILRWSAVRAGERHHIFPYQSHADEVFDSSLVYELAVLKVYAERYLLEVPQGHPAYTTAFRLLQLVDRFIAIYPDHVPATSLLREFIGGSGFE